ncbi:MAG: transcription antiterminator [Erysipelotrichia bacterium]|nr:transcription antiterminator [Erysipelotrichia bacterium]
MIGLNNRILRILLEIKDSNKPITSEQLAFITGVSSRTIKSDIRRLSSVLQKYGGKIIAKQGQGYSLEVFDEEKFSLLDDHLKTKYREEKKRIPQTSEERINYIIMKLLSVDFPVDMDDLADEMYVEKPTLYSCLKKVEIILKRYKLFLQYNQHNSILLAGSEIYKRICIAEFFFHNYFNDKIQAEDNLMFPETSLKVEIKRIKAILLGVLKDYSIQISAYSVENFTIHIMIALRRWMLFDYAKISDEIADKIKGTLEEKAGKALADRLAESFGIVLPQSEAIYFSLHLKSKRINVKHSLNDDTLKHTRLRMVINKTMQEIKEQYGVDIVQDQTIYDYVLVHVSAMIERLEIGFPLRNYESGNAVKENLVATIFARRIIFDIEKEFSVFVDENEEGYLALYFSLALSRKRMSEGLTIAVITGTGRPEGIILYSKINFARKGNNDEIRLLDVTELDNIDESQYDIIISSTGLPQIKNIPVLILKNFNYYDPDRLSVLIEKSLIGNEFYKLLLDENNVYDNLQCSYESELISEINNLLSENKEDDKDVIGDYSITELGNGCALLCTKSHPDKSFVRIFNLRKQIVIDKNLIQTIIYADCNISQARQFILLMDFMTRWLKNDELVLEYRKNPTYENLMRCIDLANQLSLLIVKK